MSRLVGASIVVGITHADDVALNGRGLTLLPTAWGGGIGAAGYGRVVPTADVIGLNDAPPRPARGVVVLMGLVALGDSV